MNDNCLSHKDFLGFGGANSSMKSRRTNRHRRLSYVAFYPDYKVFIDRRQTSVEIYDKALLINDAEPGWKELLDR
jgi:hypothetical protein